MTIISWAAPVSRLCSSGEGEGKKKKRRKLWSSSDAFSSQRNILWETAHLWPLEGLTGSCDCQPQKVHTVLAGDSKTPPVRTCLPIAFALPWVVVWSSTLGWSRANEEWCPNGAAVIWSLHSPDERTNSVNSAADCETQSGVNSSLMFPDKCCLATWKTKGMRFELKAKDAVKSTIKIKNICNVDRVGMTPIALHCVSDKL